MLRHVLLSCALTVAFGQSRTNTNTWRRIALTAQRFWYSLASDTSKAITLPQINISKSLSDPPSLPSQCDFQYDSQQGYAAEQAYLQANSPCQTRFEECFQGMTPTSECTGTYYCTANIDILADQCDTTYCEVSGENAQPVNPNIPPFVFRMAACYPDDCDQSTHDQVLLYTQYMLCGSMLYTSPDCQVLQLNCAYDLSTSTIWIIVGSVVGFFVFAIICLYLWWICTRKSNDVELEIDEDDQYTALMHERAAYENAINMDQTYADMARPGGTQSRVLQSDDGL